jgi:hypothetical protein
MPMTLGAADGNITSSARQPACMTRHHAVTWRGTAPAIDTDVIRWRNGVNGKPAKPGHSVGWHA